MSNILATAARIVNPAPAVEASDPFLVNEAWWSGFTQGSDGFALEVPADMNAADLVEAWGNGHFAGWDCWESEILAAAAEPTAEDEAWWLGYQLGADGDDGLLMAPDEAERAAFERGHDAGDDHLWRVDPSFAAYLKERAERAALESAMSGGTCYCELVESGGDRARAVA